MSGKESPPMLAIEIDSPEVIEQTRAGIAIMADQVRMHVHAPMKFHGEVMYMVGWLDALQELHLLSPAVLKQLREERSKAFKDALDMYAKG